MSTFRIATLNIHSFRTASSYNSNISDLVSILEPLNLDLIAVQEIQTDDKWKIFCKRLCLPNFISGQCSSDSFYNGIASRYPIKFCSNQQANISCVGGRRSMLQCSLGGDHPFVINRLFAVTHLDHLYEDDRLTQIKKFNPQKQNIDILMGDMNALTRDDYSDKYYQDAVLRIRENTGWEKPHFDLTKLITDEWNYQDAFRLKNAQIEDEQIATCRFGTRIDYIYVQPCVTDQWILSECSIIDTKGATDHNAVFAEFTQISK